MKKESTSQRVVRQVKEVCLRTEFGRKILRYHEEGRLKQGTWGTEEKGRHYACILGTNGLRSASQCPAEVMPQWMAHSIVTLFDGVNEEDAMNLGQRFGAALVSLNGHEPNWDRIKVRFLARCVRNSLLSAEPACKDQLYWSQVQKSCDRVIELLEREDRVTPQEWSAAYAAAYGASAASAAANAAANAAYAAAYGANAAANAANAAANAAAYAAANAAANAAAYAAASAAYGANAAAKQNAMAAIFLGMIEDMETEAKRLSGEKYGNPT